MTIRRSIKLRNEKLEALREAEVISSDAEEKFGLRKKIEALEAEIAKSLGIEDGKAFDIQSLQSIVFDLQAKILELQEENSQLREQIHVEESREQFTTTEPSQEEGLEFDKQKLIDQPSRPELSDDDKLLLRFVARYNKPIKVFEMEAEMEARMEWPAVKTQHHLDNLRDAKLLDHARVPGSGLSGAPIYGWELSKAGRAFWVRFCQQEPAIPPVKVKRCDHCNEEVTSEAIEAYETSTGHLLYDKCPHCGKPTPTPSPHLLGDP